MTAHQEAGTATPRVDEVERALGLAWFGLTAPLDRAQDESAKYRALAKDLERDLTAAREALEPHPLREGLIPGADKLEETHHHANYWLEGGRKHIDVHPGEAFLACEQAVNSWKNAAYAMAEQLHAAEAALAGVREECAKVCEETAIYARIDGKNRFSSVEDGLSFAAFRIRLHPSSSGSPERGV